jgi:serine/threonine protein kinase
MSAMPELDDPDWRGTTPRPVDNPSPVESGAAIGGWTVGSRIDVRGDVHLHLSAAPDTLRVAVWRYRGYEPLPRFLEQLRRDAAAWGAFRTSDGRLGAVVPTVDVARIPGQMVFYWAQEDPRGPSLASRLDQSTLLAPAFALDVARQLGAALEEIHGRGLVHGDLDPSNVHLAGSLDLVRLAWGGLASRLERAGIDVGRGKTRSLAEVAPEVLMGAVPGPRSDLYGLAALTFRMLAGQPPWLVRRSGPVPGVTDDNPLPPLPEWVVSPLPELLAIALQRDPNRRPDSVGDWCDRLAQAAAAVEAMPAPPGSWAPPDDELQPTPPTVTRTLSPMERLMAPDPALSNTPPGSMAPTPLPGVRSVVPALGRTATPMVTSLPPPERTPPPPSLRAPQAPSVRRPRPSTPALAPFALGSMMIVGFTAVLAAVLCSGPFARAPGPPAAIPVPVVISGQPPAAASAAPAAAPQIMLYSDPATADVLRDGERVGVTPMAVTLPGPDEAPLRLELRKAGFRARAVEIGHGSEDVVEHLAPLQPASSQSAPQPGAPQPVIDLPADLPPLRPR